MSAGVGCGSLVDKARAAKEAKDYAKAESLYKQSMTKDKEELDRQLAREELVDLLVEIAKEDAKADPARAEGLYREALELDPGDEAAQDGLGRLLASISRTDEAIKVLGGEAPYGKCDLCQRYLAVLLVQRARTFEEKKQYDAALADYTRALSLISEANYAFSAARVQLLLKNEDGAAKAIEDAVPMIRPDDRQAQANFLKIREEAVLRAAGDGNLALVDRYMAMFPPGAGGDPWYFLQLRVARELRRQGDIEAAIGRLEPLLGESHRQTLPDGYRKEMEQLVGSLLKIRGSNFLRDGKLAEADASFAKASEYLPEDDTLKLLRALTLGGRGEVERALQVTRALPAATYGHAEVVAILESLTVFERLDVGDVEGAKAALLRAQAAAPDAPETHVASAAILAVTPVAGLSKKEVALLRKSGLARYGDGVFRFGEALSEIAWAREQAKNLGEVYPFRGPGSTERRESLERRIHESYPFEVGFNSDPTTVLTVRTKAGTKEITVSGPGGLDERVFVSTNAPNPITINEPGIITFAADKSKSVLYTEPYTTLKVVLP
ncbi:MAG: hypothetical protein R3B09_33300 [Nannocystaceae bacterium]